MSQVELRNFVPVSLIDTAAVLLVLIVILGLLYKLGVWRKVIPPRMFADASNAIGISGITETFLAELGSRVILQRNLVLDSKVRLFAHHCVFWGFVSAAISTTLVYIYHPEAAPRQFFEPAKIFGNASAVLLLIGSAIILGRLAVIPSYRKERKLGDMIFLVAIFLTAVSGVATEAARILHLRDLAYASYALHLMVVTILLGSAPFTHFMHAVTTPVLRWTDRIHTLVAARSPIMDYKEEAMLAQIAELYQGNPKQKTK